MFYIKEKDPQSAENVCELYDRYLALTGDNRKTVSIRGVKPCSDDARQQPSNGGVSETQHLTAALQHLADRTDRQFQQLTDVVSRLSLNAAHSQAYTPGPAMQYTNNNGSQYQSYAHQPAAQNVNNNGTRQTPEVPRKPCPQCKETGHWRRDCPLNQSNNKPTGCWKCGDTGHIMRNCPNQGNARGPVSAPNSRSAAKQDN
jgi:hypothetical protein